MHPALFVFGPTSKAVACWDSREVRESYFLLGSSEKCRLVSLTTTPDRATRAIRLGMAMRPLRVSAMAQARSSYMVAPTKMTMMKMI